MDTVLPKVSQIFEYLYAVKSLSERTIYSLRSYEKFLWQADLPNVEGCYINGNGEKEEAWLEIHKQDIPTTPALPQVLHEWVLKWSDPEEEPNFQKSRIINNEEEWFEDDELRVGIYRRWIEEEWRTWANKALPKTKVQALYMELFVLHQRFQREGDELELVWGHGLLDWRINGINIERPLLITRLELQFDAKNGVFMLLPTSMGTVMEFDMFNNVEVPNIQRIQEMGRQLAATDLDVRDENNISPLLLEMVQTISSEGQFAIERIANKEGRPSISYTPVIMLREKGGRLWQEELATIIELLKNGLPIPDPIKLLTTEDDSITNAIAESASKDPAWGPVGEDLLFPLPANFEQKLIAQKLASSSGLIVQGPPGTGKSHTIVNLVSHLLAHGKRVLVTSEKERALQVLRDKIPQEIRDLCVSVLGGDTKSVKELEDSIRYIAENMDRLQPDVLSKNIKRDQHELHEIRQKIQKIKHEINKAAELENEIVNVEGEQLLPIEIGKWLSQHCELDWLPDALHLDATMPLSQNELQQLFDLLNSLSSKDIKQLELARPEVNHLPVPTEFEQKVIQIKRLKEKLRGSEDYIRGWGLSDEAINLMAITEQINDAVKNLEKLEADWCQTILNDVMNNESRVAEWLEFYEDMSAKIQLVSQLEKELLDVEVVFPEGINITKAKEDLIQLSTKLKADKEASWLLKNVFARKYNYLFEELRINGLPIRKKGDTEVLLKHLEVVDTKNKICLAWNRTMSEFDAPTMEPAKARFRSVLEDQLTFIKIIITWKNNVIVPITTGIMSLGVPEPFKWSDKEWFQQILLGISALEDKRKWDEAHLFFNDIEQYLSNGRNIENTHFSWTNLMNACQNLDIECWSENYLKIHRLQNLEADYQTFTHLIQKLRQVVPNWTQKLLDRNTAGIESKLPSDLQQAWKWSKLNNWLKVHREHVQVEEKEAELSIELKSEARIITQLVANSTWLSQLQRITKSQKSSLIAWLNAMKRIGKGTGKYASAFRKEASEEMKTCRGAIPVWIMPIRKVIENIQLNGDLFDVVIVDESSQSDLFALSVLMRAKKVVVVGDDNQISPENVGHDMGEVMGLIDRYLQGIPHKNRFELKTSLYDIASQVFDHRIVLKEHFRCVPEIIQFSNDLMYGGHMDPLRLPLPYERIEPPVHTVFVDGGYRDEHTSKALNRPEAEALVEYVVNCCNDEAYDGKTFGVISLQGHDQAKIIEELLRERIGEEEMLARRLVSGDSYSFQGDERDVIFLSMVAANNLRIGALSKRSDMQRFNVAASRARDQMILFHSVELRDLNPSCARYQLLSYCKEPSRTVKDVSQYEQEFDSQFEKDVFTLISARGYRVIPQVKVGTVGKRIDLVIEGMRGRLAVECDGDKWHGLDKWHEDMERQRILERVGWKFWRVRGSAFYRDPVQAMESLWVKLDELGITPVGTKDQMA
ncbi:AAA domain-containing protein [Paenibacillus sp. MMS18-CY102]|uniref:AAA domain-containing protein n=1 Tax=Paenibacillus sp. MMS18-CY102 TaxID=2682849 RepID=UPI001F471FBB|nr:AAA domain-containing protein [Paenibacillus sp. MMS18-CY102]